MSNEIEFLSDFGNELFSPSTDTIVKTGEALIGKTVMIYFSAHWCPPCRKFTPKLIKFYKNMKKDKEKGAESLSLFLFLLTEANQHTMSTFLICLGCAPNSLSPRI